LDEGGLGARLAVFTAGDLPEVFARGSQLTTDLVAHDQGEDGGGVDLFDERSPRSLLNLLKPAKDFLAAVKALPAEKLDMSERELEAQISPTKEHRLLKIAFWDEYRRAQRAGRTQAMVLGNVMHGICGRSYFYTKVVADPHTLAWLISPPVDEMVVQKELLRLGYQKLSEVLDLPFVDTIAKMGKNGQVFTTKRVNVGLIKEVRAIVEQLQNRVHGAVIQRQQIEAKTMNVNVTEKGEMSMDDLNRLARKLEDVMTKLPEIEGEVVE
jgi:hypothetical protein